MILSLNESFKKKLKNLKKPFSNITSIGKRN